MLKPVRVLLEGDGVGSGSDFVGVIVVGEAEVGDAEVGEAEVG